MSQHLSSKWSVESSAAEYLAPSQSGLRTRWPAENLFRNEKNKSDFKLCVCVFEKHAVSWFHATASYASFVFLTWKNYTADLHTQERKKMMVKYLQQKE